MRLSPPSTLLAAALPSIALAAHSFDCADIVKDKVQFNLQPLGGPHLVHHIEDDELITTNHTYTIDICQPLKRTKDVPQNEECPQGARVCGIDYVTSKNTNKTRVEKVVPIAGDFVFKGRGWDPQWSLLRNSDSHADAKREGLRVELNGGQYPLDDKKAGTAQKAVIEFVCDKERSGLEGDEQDDRPKEESRLRRRDDGEDEAGAPKGKSLVFRSYETEGKDADQQVAVLRLDWYTKYACEDEVHNPDSAEKGGWGLFTWFLIILFLLISAYLVFGSWLNWNRYGARGWDLLPHGDTIRDMPYVVKDWGRRVANTVQGPTSRGGYSAV